MEFRLFDNEAQSQYEFHIAGETPLIQYKRRNDKIYLIHTEVPPSLGHRGIGTSLVRKVLEDIKGKGLKLIPLCPFVIEYIKEHPEWKEIIDDRYHMK